MMCYYLYLAICVILASMGQVFLKFGARNSKNLYGLFINPFTLMGYVLLGVVTIFTVLALEGIELKVLYAIMSLNYVLVTAFSRLFLDETIGTDKVIATALIVMGVVVFNL